MAVQDGYGKSSGSESLVFAYDLKDTVNSYRGEPATNSQNADISSMTQVGFDSWSCYDGSPPYHTWGTNQSKTFVTIPGPFGASVNVMLYHNFNGGFYGPTDWDGVPNGTITEGRTYTVQGWVKAADSNSIGKTVKPYTYYSHSGGAYSAGTNYTLTDQWQLVSHTHTVQYRATGGGIMYFFTENSGEVKMYLTMTGVFLDKSHAVPWIVGGSTRSNTQGLLDLTGNSSIDLSSVSFDSNAQITLDGTDDWLNIPTTLNAGDFTYETVMRSGDSSYQIFAAGFGNPSGGGTTIQTFVNSSGALINLYEPVGVGGWVYGSYSNLSGYVGVVNTNRHIVVVNSGTNWKTYVNGTLVGDVNFYTPSVGSEVGVARVAMQGASLVPTSVEIVKIYNRTLTSTEITNNYLKYKRQYGLT